MSKAMTLRIRILQLLEHMLAVGPPVSTYRLGAIGRELYKSHTPVLRRYAAGDDMPLDELFTALQAFECVALATSDRALFLLVVAARDAIGPRCSWTMVQAFQQAQEKAFRSLGIQTTRGGT